MPKQVLLLGIGIAAWTVFLYQPMLPAHFVSDDYYLWKVVRELAFRDSFRLFLPPLLGGINSIQHTGHYAPLSAWLIWLITVPLQMEPYPAHSLSLLLHVATIFIIAVFCYLITHDKKVALLSALVFGTFPYTTETVNYISVAMYLLGSLFYLSALGSLYLFLTNFGKFWLFLHFVIFFLSLLSAEIAITLPLAVVVLISFRKKQNPMKVLKDEYRLFLTYLAVILVYFWYWALSLGTINIFIQAGRFEANQMSRMFLVFLLLVLFLIAARIGFNKFIPKDLKSKERIFWVLVSFVGISWLPTVKFLTQQRYLYLPVSFAAMSAAYLFMTLYRLLPSQLLKRVAFVSLLILLTMQSWLVYQSSLVWLKAGETAHSILIQLSQKLQNHDTRYPIYLINIPDSVDGAYIHRSYFGVAYEQLTGKSPPQLIFTPMTLGIDSHVKITSPNHLQLTSRNGFVLFKPSYDASDRRVIEWPKVYRAIETDPYTLEVEFLEPSFNWKEIFVYSFENGDIKALRS